MIIEINNELTITEPDNRIMAYCNRELVIDNPDFAKRERLGLWTGKTPAKLYLYRMDAGRVICPVGTIYAISDIIKHNDIKAQFGSRVYVHEAIRYNAKINLYDYQQDAVDAICKRQFGILQAPAGSGKTQMGIAIIDRLKCKTLWLTHTKDLLKQSYDRAVQCGIDKKLLGTITDGKIDIAAGITFATVQTLAKQDLARYKDAFDCIIVDECHRVAGTPTSATQFSKVLNSLAAVHKYGLSATVHRADGLIKTTFALLGPIMHIVPESAVKSRVMSVNVHRVDTQLCKVPIAALDTDGTIIYSKLITEIAGSKLRNYMIMEHLVDCCECYNLILSDRLDQLHALYDLLPPELQEQAAVIDGKMTTKKGKAEREQAIEDMRAGKKHFLFASYKLAKEGLDIPRLDRLHLATPVKDYAIVVQSIGRIARTFPGKDEPVCYDYVDRFGLAQNMYRARCRHYKKCGAEIERR